MPKAQSQPSTMVMNSSTYVITFTDATGDAQTIDLPLESLFQDANYEYYRLPNGVELPLPEYYRKKIYSEEEREKLWIEKPYRDWETDRKSTRLNSSHSAKSRMPSSA